MPKLEITSQERSTLRAAAHPLNPVVLIGDRGLTDAVLKEIDLNLNAHSLIKVRINGQERPERESMLETICDSLSCASVHHLGKTIIIYRPDLAKEQAKTEAANATRALRKPTEPYTPKKMAAIGEKRTRKNEISERSARKTERLQSAAPRARRADSESNPHSIPRRAGSSLSLRAGRRPPTARAAKITKR